MVKSARSTVGPMTNELRRYYERLWYVVAVRQLNDPPDSGECAKANATYGVVHALMWLLA
jgi:hypothetical protein